MLRRPIVSCAAVAIALAFTSASVAHAEGSYTWKPHEGEEHGSQVASSEWLPIFLGASGGVIVGALVGTAFDDHQPPTLGALVGGGVGGLAGGGAGAWIIRTMRDQDTRVAGAVTGGAVGLGIGCLLFNATITSDSGATKVGGAVGLVALPVMGLFAGRALAIDFGGDKSNVKTTPMHFASIQPSFVPVAGPRDQRPSGMTVGLSGTFF
jgi:hypothetical protein